jgi:hypothetical protein
MLMIPNNAKVFLALTPVDFRKQIPGLKKWVERELQLNPLAKNYFIFMSRNRKSIKILNFDGQGMCLYTKRLSVGKFKKWGGLYDASFNHVELAPTQGNVILMNGSAEQLQIPKNWR